MLQSRAFIKTKREAPKDEVSVNAQLLLRGGYVDKLAGGIYSFLPLGFLVLEKIENIIREEMNVIGGQELLMPALHPKELWDETKRWETMDDLYKLKDRQEKWWALGPTHEEVITDIIRKQSWSYKDLPFYLYQIQTKFRDELRSKSGLLRGREFAMKDLYSFHTSEEDRKKYYEIVKKAYLKIFKRCGLFVVVAEAGGGSFSKESSHEFQVPTPAGEDVIVLCEHCGWAKNIEIAEVRASAPCPVCGRVLKEEKAIEAGNIFTLGTKFSQTMGAFFTDRGGERKPMIMGCYGMGLGRILGAVVETHNDSRGIIWPKELAPFRAHIIALASSDKAVNKRVFAESARIYKELIKKGVGALYDDRADVPAGQKFADSDLIGARWRIVISEKTLVAKKVEIKARSGKSAKLVSVNSVFKIMNL